jgi:hypothetical protein
VQEAARPGSPTQPPLLNPRSTGEGEDPAAASLAARAEARRLIMAGDMAAAVALLQVRVFLGGAGRGRPLSAVRVVL